MPSDSVNHSKTRLIPEGIGMSQLRGVKNREQDVEKVKYSLKIVKTAIF
jgi:hypothetical protein